MPSVHARSRGYIVAALRGAEQPVAARPAAGRCRRPAATRSCGRSSTPLGAYTTGTPCRWSVSCRPVRVSSGARVWRNPTTATRSGACAMTSAKAAGACPPSSPISSHRSTDGSASSRSSVARPPARRREHPPQSQGPGRGQQSSRRVAVVSEQPVDPPMEALRQGGDVEDGCVTGLGHQCPNELGHPERRTQVTNRRPQQATYPPPLPPRRTGLRRAVHIDDHPEPGGDGHSASVPATPAADPCRRCCASGRT